MRSGCIWGLTLALEGKRSKHKPHKSLEMPQIHPERIITQRQRVSHFYFFILDHFQAIYEIELSFHTNSRKSHPRLGPPVVLPPKILFPVIASGNYRLSVYVALVRLFTNNKLFGAKS